jgi:hypothetical protein
LIRDPGLSEVLVGSLREQSLMDAHFSSARVRVIGGYDRTDQFVVEDMRFIDSVIQRVRDAGLFILWP